jgi:hypothetical protein
VIESLADTRVAIAIVNFSWRQERAAAFDLGYAPMFGHLMARFPDSAQPLLDDLIGSGKTPPALSGPEAQALCRILLDMPDIGMWRQNALKILPLYRRAAESLLVQDMHGSDQDKSYQAQRWLLDLKSDVPGIASEQPMPRRRPIRSQAPVPDREPNGDRTVSILRPSPELDRGSLPTSTSSAPAHPPTIAVPVSPSVPPAPDPAASPYTGPQSGTLESNGSPIAQNAECVFRSLPPLKLQLDYDTKTWDARLAPGEGQTQRLILKNKSSGPQKRCVVHWKVVP